MNKKNIIIFSVILFIVVIFILFFSVQKGDSQDVLFSIKKGQSVVQIAENLKKEGFIHTKLYFYVYVFLTGTTEKLQAGDYMINKNMSVGDIVVKFATGEIIPNEVEITVIPGWDLEDIGKVFENNNIFSKEEVKHFFDKDRGYDYNFLFDKPKTIGYEGYLYPDTYIISKDESLKKIAEKFFNNFDKKIDENLKQEILRQGKTIFEVVTMASLLEKEVATYEDKQLVAGILWKRIKNNMPLQVDATLWYFLNKTSKELTLDDLKIKSPYNTYLNLGLPIGPIANPSLESIKAAIYPKSSKFWYYLSNEKGETVFSKTFEEHKKAKAKYFK